MNNVFQFDYT